MSTPPTDEPNGVRPIRRLGLALYGAASLMFAAGDRFAAFVALLGVTALAPRVPATAPST